MILENEETLLGGLMADLRRIAAAFATVALLTLFIALLFAPAFEPWLCRDLYHRAGGSSGDWRKPVGIDGMKKAEDTILIVRIALWGIAILAWIAFIALNMGYNLYGY